MSYWHHTMADGAEFWISSQWLDFLAKGGFKSEEAGELLLLQIKYSKSLSWAKN